MRGRQCAARSSGINTKLSICTPPPSHQRLGPPRAQHPLLVAIAYHHFSLPHRGLGPFRAHLHPHIGKLRRCPPLRRREHLESSPLLNLLHRTARNVQQRHVTFVASENDFSFVRA